MGKLHSVAEKIKDRFTEQPEDTVNQNLATFHDLDFNRFSKQDWDGFHRSHAEDIVVHFPDGRTTKGFEKHIEDMKYMFSFAPDTRITNHSIKFGQGDWTSVVGVMEGTFTKPMITPDGKTIQPTNKSFKIDMCTVGHWKNGLMIEEFLFWDNMSYMKQIGVA